MKGDREVLCRISGTLALLLALGGATTAVGEIDGEVIAAHNRLTGNYAVMAAANGAGFTEMDCGGDLTYQGVPRYFLKSVPGTTVLPDGYLNNQMVAADENCAQTMFLFGQPANMRFSTVPRWSPDGSRIAVYARAFDLDSGIEIASGIHVADVVREGTGRPVGIENLALEIPLPGEASISWSGDGSRLAYVGSLPDGQGGQQTDIFVHHLGTTFSYNVTETDASNENNPSWSPVDERIAFQRLVSDRNGYRWDIFTVSSAGGPATQVTSRRTTGQPQNIMPCFSPDGEFLSFSGGDAWFDNDIYRIRADGSGKAVKLTRRRDGDFRLNFWRR